MDVPDDDDDLNANSAFLGLPDDILICILGFLDIPTQLLLTKLHPRLLEIMPNVWRSENKHATLNLFEKSISNRDLNFLLESTQKTLKCLRLKMEDRRTWDILTNYVYPSVNDFRFSTYSFMLNNSDVPKMIQSFPNLRTLSPFGNFTGENFENFQFLENLTVTYCKLLQIDHLGNILKTRKIKSLQLNVFDFDRFVPAINLPLDGHFLT
ncbi:uncharacterized protein LOC108113028 isoform X2 [Drosophila eugracilis]|uniref:uncharacterized protein LOC108113028 isoform X2 n=1 Tax=Drosophila eugracilis TaxID=29029 RepID=UPI0007E6A642|nr:uncharacterized protein LOC108113028 isoform X2 [Drosophila eugracilis]